VRIRKENITVKNPQKDPPLKIHLSSAKRNYIIKFLLVSLIDLQVLKEEHGCNIYKYAIKQSEPYA
jgi:hypothetical protein